MRATPSDNKIYTFASVIFNEEDVCTYCYIADEEIHAGDLAAVMTSEGVKYVLVVFIARTTADKAPYPFERLKHIEGRVAKGEPEYNALFNKFVRNIPTFYDGEADEWA